MMIPRQLQLLQRWGGAGGTAAEATGERPTSSIMSEDRGVLNRIYKELGGVEFREGLASVHWGSTKPLGEWSRVQATPDTEQVLNDKTQNVSCLALHRARMIQTIT